jgi:TatD DNase family protein
MLVDSHCHLDFPEFAPELDAVVARARQAGIGTMLTIGTRKSTFEKVRSIAERFDEIYCSFGIHPHEADKETAMTTEQLIAVAQHPKVIGFGETGLDYYYEHSPREQQQRSFRAHIAASRETGLPLIVHTRNADEDMTAILTEEAAKGPFPGLIHCFSSSAQLARTAVDLGLFISISGIVTFKAAGDLRETVKGVPLDRLLVETDAPYLAPVPNRGKRNEPAFVVHTAAQVAQLKTMSPDELARATSDNFFRLFKKAKRPA